MNLSDCILILVCCVSIRMRITSNVFLSTIAKKVKGRNDVYVRILLTIGTPLFPLYSNWIH